MPSRQPVSRGLGARTHLQEVNPKVSSAAATAKSPGSQPQGPKTRFWAKIGRNHTGAPRGREGVPPAPGGIESAPHCGSAHKFSEGCATANCAFPPLKGRKMTQKACFSQKTRLLLKFFEKCSAKRLEAFLGALDSCWSGLYGSIFLFGIFE